jgi:hypothetical protein
LESKLGGGHFGASAGLFGAKLQVGVDNMFGETIEF